MERIGYSILFIYLFIYFYNFFLYRGLEVGGGSGAKKTYYGIPANGELAVHVYVVYVSREFKESYTGPYKAYCPCAFRGCFKKLPIKGWVLAGCSDQETRNLF